MDLDELERLLATATPGEWAIDGEQSKWGANILQREGALRTFAHFWADSGSACDNARLVVALHNAAPALIAAARREREAREVLTEMIDCDTCLGTGGTLDDPCTNCAKARAWLAEGGDHA